MYNIIMIYFGTMLHEHFLVKLMKTCMLLKINLKKQTKLKKML